MTDSQFKFFTNIKDSIKNFSFDFSDDVILFITGISCLESNFGTSRVAVEDHNIFGMDSPVKRFTLQYKNDGRFAVYHNILLSFLDFTYWLTWNRFTQLDFKDISLFLIKFEKSGFNSSSNYVDSVKKIVLAYEKQLKASAEVTQD